jgi:hypothetical protein
MKPLDQIKACIQGSGGSIFGEGATGVACKLWRGSHTYHIVFAWGLDWEHATVTVPNEKRLPTAEELSWIKDIFWLNIEVVMQLFMPPDGGVHLSSRELHLWRPRGGVPVPVPPPALW